jgi:hypothetical protein
MNEFPLPVLEIKAILCHKKCKKNISLPGGLDQNKVVEDDEGL